MPSVAGWRCRWNAGETCENGNLKGAGEGGEGESSVSPKSVHQIAMIPALIKLETAPLKCKRIVIGARARARRIAVRLGLEQRFEWGEEFRKIKPICSYNFIFRYEVYPCDILVKFEKIDTLYVS